MKKRLLSILLVLCMMIGLLPVIAPTAQASTNEYSQADAVAWIRRSEGTANDIDGFAGVQCVDLVKWYIETLGHSLGSIGYAYNLYRYTDEQLNLPSWGWSRHYNSEVPLPGDIVVIDAGAFPGVSSDGHCGLIYDVDINAGQYYYIDYNCGGNNEGGTKQEMPLHDFSCVIRPDWPYLFDAATGTLTISGTGAASLSAYNGVGSMSKADIKSIVIKDGITSIATDAFKNCENLISITIPDSVTEIRDTAFYHCENLKSVVIPNSVTSTGQYVFDGCSALTDVTLSDQLTTIESGLFSDCTSLSSISIPAAVTSIGVDAFYHTNLYSVTIPDGVTTLSRLAFSGCKNLTTIYIPATVTSMGSSVFNSCTSLKDVYYGGTKQQFDAIEASVNTSIFVGCGNNYTIHYESSAPENPPPTNLKQVIQQLAQQALKNILGVASIRCPVDVEISVNGQTVGKIENNVASGVDESKIYVHVENDEKYIYFLTSDKFTINLTATGTGTMEYSVQNLDVPSWTTLDEKYFRKVELTSGKKMVSEIDYLDTELVDTPNVQLYVLGGTDNSTPVKKVLPDNKGTEVPLNTPVISFDTAVDSISILPMAVGDDGILSELPVLTRSGYTFNGWYMPDGTKVDTNTVFTADTTVKAQWTKNSPGGDSPSNPGGSTTTPTVPSGPSYNPGGTYTPPTYSITTPSVTGGKVSVSPSSASSGSTVTVTATPDTGYELASLTVSDSTGKALELTAKGNGQYSFKMPNSKVSLSAEFRLLGTNASWNNPFVDVSIGDWYYDAVRFVSENGLMNGVGNGYFSPNTNLSRAMFAQILYNKAGQPSVVDSSAFNDVPIGAWYADAVTWAAANDIVGGYGDGMFGPDDPITREQLAVMLWRYVGKPVPPNLLLNFTDADRVSGYALDALCWAVDQGIINGKGNGILDPKGFATRAEVAQILKNYQKK